MIAVEITAAVDGGGTLQTFYAATDTFVSLPTDTPANQAFEPAVEDAGSLGISVFSDGATGGGTKLETGEIVIVNNDGTFDAWKDYGFDGRSIVIRSGQVGQAYPGAWSTVFSGTMEAVECTSTKVVIRLRDKQYIFAVPVQGNVYGGTNALPAGVDGTADDLEGKPKPLVFGKVLNISSPCVNTSLLTYQVNDGAVASIDAVYDRGVALTPGTNYATSSALQAATTAAGTFDTCVAQGYFQLGSSPSGTVTADVSQGATAADRTTAQLLKALGTRAGLAGGSISSADVTALDSLSSAVVGIFIDDDTTYIAAMDTIAASAGAYYVFDASGVLRMGQLDVPSGTPALALQSYDVSADIERRPARDNSVPVWSVTVNHTKVWTQQSTDLAGGVSAARRAYLADATRSATKQSAAVKNQFLLATTAVIDTLLTSATDARTEAARQLNLLKVPRDVFDFSIPFSTFADAGIWLMSVVSLTYPRFGLSGGKSFRVIGLRFNFVRFRVQLTLWG